MEIAEETSVVVAEDTASISEDTVSSTVSAEAESESETADTTTDSETTSTSVGPTGVYIPPPPGTVVEEEEEDDDGAGKQRDQIVIGPDGKIQRIKPQDRQIAIKKDK